MAIVQPYHERSEFEHLVYVFLFQCCGSGTVINWRPGSGSGFGSKLGSLLPVFIKKIHRNYQKDLQYFVIFDNLLPVPI